MVTKPTIGQQDWGTVLNAALDELLPAADASATYVTAETDAMGGVTLYLDGDEL